MVRRNGIPVRVRRVSSELKELRLRSGLSAEEVASALGISMSKLSRMESGQRGLCVDDVSALLGLYRVPALRRDELLALVRSGADRNWWQVKGPHLPEMWDDLVRFEQEAVSVHNYETMVVPGLLQTSEYAAAIAEGTDPALSPAEVDSIVVARTARQKVLHASAAPTFDFLIEQSALERVVGGRGLMYRQIRHLISAASRDNVAVHLLPSSLGAHPGMEGPFVLMAFRNHADLVHLENRSSSAFLEEVEHVVLAKNSLSRLHDVALSAGDSIEFMATIAAELA